MARALSPRIITSSTMMAAEAAVLELLPRLRCQRVDLHRQRRDRRSCRPSGSNRTDPARPTTISGAASPMARDSPRMVPVAMPGTADGQRLPPGGLPHRGAERERALPDVLRDGSHASRVVMMMTGRISSASATAPPSTMPVSLEAEQCHDGDRQQAVDDGGHRGEVLQVDLDQPVPPARWCRRTPRGTALRRCPAARRTAP